MKQNPWTSASVGLLGGKGHVVDLAAQLAAIDKILRVMMALPEGAVPQLEPTPRRKLAASVELLRLASDAIFSEHAKALRHTIANSHGPIGPLGSPSGASAYVDLAELVVGALGQIQKGKQPDPPKNRFLRCVQLRPGFWSADAYSCAAGWIHANLAPLKLDEIATCAVQDLVRLRNGLALTPQELKDRKARKKARSVLFESGWRLTNDAAEILELLPKSPHYAKFVVIRCDMEFKDRKLMTLLGHLQAFGCARNRPRCGYCITEFGLALLRFRSERD